MTRGTPTTVLPVLMIIVLRTLTNWIDSFGHGFDMQPEAKIRSCRLFPTLQLCNSTLTNSDANPQRIEKCHLLLHFSDIGFALKHPHSGV